MQDYTAIIVAELQLRDYVMLHNGETEGGDIHYVIRHSERLPLRTSYRAITDRIAVIYRETQTRTIHTFNETDPVLLAYYRKQKPNLHFECYIDATGVGKPVFDLLENEGISINAVVLTGGQNETWDGPAVRFPKTWLVSHMQTLLQEHLVHFPSAPPAAAQLSQATADELLNFELRITENANVKSGVFKVGEHDDLSIALGLACWEYRDNFMHFGPAPEAFQKYWFSRGA
jgi:hypothetical protein